jgi:hypothetical protein
MTDFFLQRRKVRPDPVDLPADESRGLQQRFDPYAGEVVIEGIAIRWTEIEEIEVAVAPRPGAAGWLVRHVVHGEERYHIGFYFGSAEAVIPNVTRSIVCYVLDSVAYYAPLPIRYKGPEGLAAVIKD